MSRLRMFKLPVAALAAALLVPASLALIAPASAQQKTTIGVSLAQDDNPFYIAMLRGIRARGAGARLGRGHGLRQRGQAQADQRRAGPDRARREGHPDLADRRRGRQRRL